MKERITLIFVALMLLLVLPSCVRGMTSYHAETACPLPAGRYAICPWE